MLHLGLFPMKIFISSTTFLKMSFGINGSSLSVVDLIIETSVSHTKSSAVPMSRFTVVEHFVSMLLGSSFFLFGLGMLCSHLMFVNKTFTGVKFFWRVRFLEIKLWIELT